MRKGLKITLIIVAVLLILAAAVFLWQWENLMALKLSLQTPKEELGQMLEETNKRVDAVAEQLPVDVRDLTEEEKAALQSGETDRETVLDSITGAQLQPEKPQTEAVNTAELEARLSRYVGEIYVMKAEYSAWLSNKNQAAIDEFVALPVEEQTTANKYKIGMRCMNEALAKEKECDAQMAEIEGKICDVLAQLGRDTAMVDEIHAAYLQEKQIQKAYYLGLH